MNVEIASLCDAATDQAGKLNILGSFDHVGGPLPLVYPHCTAAFRIRWESNDAGDHTLTLKFQDVRGIPLIPPLQSTINVPPMPPEVESHAINLVLNFQQIRLEREGKYVMTFSVDGVDQATLPLYVSDTTPHEPNPLR